MKREEIRFEFGGALAETVGEAEGLTKKEWDALAHETTDIARRVEARRAETPYRDLPGNAKLSQIAAVLASARAKKGKFDDLVVLGIGGSALGLTALKTALCPPYWNHLPPEKRAGRPRLWVMDNVDPAEFAALLDLVDTERTLFNVISKSGETAETMSQFLVALDFLKNGVGDGWKEHLVVITQGERTVVPSKANDRYDSALRDYARAAGLKPFECDPEIGGRFSVLSPVGLFGAAMIGMDVEAILAGAAAMDKRCSETAFEKNPAAQGAAVQIGLYRKGKPMSVMMPYAAALRDVADWFRQLWAESLGKTRADGTAVGPTPIKALGATDQHSQVQLYRDGPNDKVFTILAVEDLGIELPIPDPPAGVAGIEYLAGRSMAELMHAEEQATVWALARLSQRPTVRLVLERITPNAVGQLLYLLEVQTSIAGEMLGINTYNQPGVEAGKEATRALMGAEGPIKNPAAKGLPAEAATYAALRKRIEAS
jgi:glucose-6-phosphate isomerase